MTNWTFKIHAYLHDPPDKPLALGRGAGHAAWGAELARLLTGTGADPAWQQAIAHADHIASGADRTGLLTPDPVSLAELRHPLSGQPIDLGQFGPFGDEARQGTVTALREEVAHLREVAADDEARFYALWGVLPARLRERVGPGELGALWDWLPAETRMPNHPVILHQALVSALASILAAEDEPALLALTVGPVQSFIAQARRTSDLAGGSAMLAESVLQAIWVVLAATGPDHVIFPALRRNNTFWRSVQQRFTGRLNVPRSLVPTGVGTAALPNRFLAVVPRSRAGDLARAAERAVRAWWAERSDEACAAIESVSPVFAGFGAMAKAQAEAFIQVSWAVAPWPAAEAVTLDDEHCRTAAWIHGGQLPPANASFISRATAHREGGGRLRPFRPNGGLLYGAAFETVEATVDAVKRARPVPTRTEDGLKCSLCGERAVVPRPEQLPFHDQREAWKTARRAVAQGLVRAGEALCGVCWTKRHYALKTLEIHAPSTAEVAAAPFKQAVLNRGGEFQAEAQALAAAAAKAGLSGAWVVPAIASRHRRDDHPLFDVPGDALLRDPRDDRDATDQEAGTRRELLHEVSRKASALRRAAAARTDVAIPLPRPYLAALILDGDQMGKWLSGALNTALEAYLSPAAADSLRAAGGDDDLRGTWPVTPALHATVSEACDVFSQHTASRTLHEDGLPAYLVYSGGDDVLALTPVGCPDRANPIELGTEAALRLRLRFSGHVRREGGSDAPAADSPAGFVVNRRDGLELAFGKRATASGALAVFHHRWPLGRALAEARAAEEFAKETLGRDALAIVILRRSGQVTRTGLKFLASDNGRVMSPVRAFQQVAHAFAFDELSPKFLSEIARRLAPLDGGLPGGALVELARPLVARALADHYLGESGEAFDRLSAAVTSLAHASGGSGPDGSGGSGTDRDHLDRWIGLVEAAAFLGRGGDL